MTATTGGREQGGREVRRRKGRKSKGPRQNRSPIMSGRREGSNREKGRKLKGPRQNRSLYDCYNVKDKRRKKGGSESHGGSHWRKRVAPERRLFSVLAASCFLYYTLGVVRTA